MARIVGRWLLVGVVVTAQPLPTAQPSALPTAQPTALPTAQPTVTVQPSPWPTAQPSALPTTANASRLPTALPTARPTASNDTQWRGNPIWVDRKNTDKGTNSNHGAVNSDGAMPAACVSYGRANCAANMFDNDETTIWHCAHEPPCQVQLDLGSSITAADSVSGIRLTTFEDRVGSAQIQYSFDGTSWKGVSSPSVKVPAPSPQTFTEHVFDAQVAQYWRLTNIMAAHSSWWPAIRELELLTAVDGEYFGCDASACMEDKNGDGTATPDSDCCGDVAAISCSAGYAQAPVGKVSSCTKYKTCCMATPTAQPSPTPTAQPTSVPTPQPTVTPR